MNGYCVFRIAAGPRLGYGHLMRARALARELPLAVAMSVRGGAAARRAAGEIGPVLRDGDALDGARLLIVDDPNQRNGRAWVSRARRKQIPCVSIHDERWAHDADLVVAPRLDAPRPATRAAVLHGTQFYLLNPVSGPVAVRRVVARRRAGRSARRTRVVVALGGGRHVHGLAQPLVDAIAARCPGVAIEVAAGFSPRRPPLSGAQWVATRNGLAGVLAGADAAVVAGGVTLYEACALGVPAVGLAVVAPQRRAIRAFASRGALLDAGVNGARGRAIPNAADAVARLLTDARLRARTASSAKALVDFGGASRVAAHIERLLATEAARG